MAVIVDRIRDYIVEVSGKHNYIINEVVVFENNSKGILMRASGARAVIALFEDSITDPVKVGDTCTPTGKEFALTFDETVLGNIVGVDGEKFTNNEVREEKIRSTDSVTRAVFRLARPIYSRDFVNEPLITGLSSVDWAIPIGKGQRELILGDRKTGKTAIALNAIVAQRETNVKTIYVAIGQKKTTVLDIFTKLKREKVLDDVVIVAASANVTATKKWLSPYVGVTIAEYFQEKYGDDVLIIYDDLSKHADAYRELSLLIKSAPAREAYPGDIFYLHSKLLERAGKFNDEFGNGSITALPIVQTEAGDLTSYIPTNVISITDGQIFTSKPLFNAGHRPAVDIPYSVSRVGSTAQTKTLASVSGGLKLKVSQFEEAQKLARLSGGATDDNREILEQGRVLMALLVQPELDVLDYETGTIILTLYKQNYLNFFEKTEEIIFIKQLLNKYLREDFLGKRLKDMILQKSVKSTLFELVNREIILPMIKHFIIEKYPYVRRNEQFIELYKDVRDDARIYKNVIRGMGAV